MRSLTVKSALVAAASCMLFSTAALASGERIVVLASDRAVHQQLTETLCVSQECVGAEKILTAGKPDFAKAAREGLTAVVVGRLNKSGAAVYLEVSVQSRSGSQRMTRKVSAESSGKVSIVDIVAASSEVITCVERPESKDPKVAKERPRLAKVKVKAKVKGKAKADKKVAARAGGSRGRG